MAIRRATIADAGAIASLRSQWDGNAEVDPEFRDRLAAWLAAEGERRTTWLAELGTDPIGMVSMLEYRRMPWPDRADSCWGYVSNTFVLAEHRRRGVGSALLAAVIATALERAYARLVTSPSTDALPFYRRHGFLAADGVDATLLLVRPDSG
jgi:GNAT superfamily N-acetyltransferase